MDRNTILEGLEMTRRHVALGERHLARQREIVAELERGGHNTQIARQLLIQFEETQRLHIDHRDRLEKELAKISK